VEETIREAGVMRASLQLSRPRAHGRCACGCTTSMRLWCRSAATWGMFTDTVKVKSVYGISEEPMSAEEWKKQFVKAG
jgi:hypothetical protein